MRGKLAKLSCVSDRIRKHALVKKAGLAGRLAGFAMKRPMPTAIAALGAMGAAGTYQRTKTKFDPAVSQAMLGQPPGA